VRVRRFRQATEEADAGNRIRPGIVNCPLLGASPVRRGNVHPEAESTCEARHPLVGRTEKRLVKLRRTEGSGRRRFEDSEEEEEEDEEERVSEEEREVLDASALQVVSIC
jgi:hypothetical protein